MKVTKRPNLLTSLSPIFILVFFFMINQKVFAERASYGPNQLVLLLVTVFLMVLGKFSYQKSFKSQFSKMKTSLLLSKDACFILLAVGLLIAIWILNGTVPAMIYYGLKLISPQFFLPIVAIISAIVSLSTGSSWSAVGTVGIAFIGMGKTLMIPEGMVAGAIVSGAFLGDKMSPLSDTTNLAPLVSGTDIISHIRHMSYTSGPAFLISVILFTFLGLSYQQTLGESQNIRLITNLIENHFNIGPHLFLLPLSIILLIIKRLSPIKTLLIGAFLGIIFAFIFQPQFLQESPLRTLLSIASQGFQYQLGNSLLDNLFHRGGIFNMLPTLFLMILAMIFGGMLELLGMLQTLSKAILKTVHGVTGLIGSTIASSIFINMTTSDVYLSIVLTGKMFQNAYKVHNLHPKNLSRTLEDAGTATAALIPWNSGGAYISAVLGVSTFCYFPFAFFNLLSPIFAFFLAYKGWTMEKRTVKQVVVFNH